MKKIILTFALMCFATVAFASEVNSVPADEALLKLKQGNEHFAKVHMKHPDESKQRRYELTKGQHPFAVIVTCSDSRVPAEILFDQGLGDLFVIRNAGNIIDEHVLGSIEYAVHHLGVKLVVIMGHQECGAVKATMGDSKESPAIESIKKAIQPALDKAKKENKLTTENVVKNNVGLGVETTLSQDIHLEEAVKNDGVKIIPAYYHLDTGVVEFLN